MSHKQLRTIDRCLDEFLVLVDEIGGPAAFQSLLDTHKADYDDLVLHLRLHYIRAAGPEAMARRRYLQKKRYDDHRTRSLDVRRKRSEYNRQRYARMKSQED